MALFEKKKKKKLNEEEPKKTAKHQKEEEVEEEETKKPAKKKKNLDIQVTVGRAHSSPKTYILNGDRGIFDALSAAGLVKKDSEIVSVNGSEVDEDELNDYELEDGDRVTLVRNVEGGNN